MVNYRGTHDIGCVEIATLTQHEVDVDTDAAYFEHDYTNVRFENVNIDFKPSSIAKMVTYLRSQVPEQLLITFFQAQLRNIRLDLIAGDEEEELTTAEWNAINELMQNDNMVWKAHANHLIATVSIPPTFDTDDLDIMHISNGFYAIAQEMRLLHDLVLDFEPTIMSLDGRTIVMRFYWQSQLFGD
jgi:hypothetical protein